MQQQAYPSLFDTPVAYEVVATDTKRLAYNAIIPELPPRRKEVYEALQKLGRATAKQIAAKLEVPINEITPRILELRKAGLVIKDGETKDGRFLNSVYTAVKADA